jgi:hypothetical protein
MENSNKWGKVFTIQSYKDKPLRFKLMENLRVENYNLPFS